MRHNLRQRSDQVNTRLGEVAQKQNRCMVRYRRLQEKVEAGPLDKRIASEKKRQETIAELRAEQDAYDHEVARHMDADASIGKEISLAEKAITESAATIKELTPRLKAATEAKKINHGVAMVKIGGNVFSGTRITGPHSTLLIQEDLKKCSIIETDRPDQSGAKQWHFEINPFR